MEVTTVEPEKRQQIQALLEEAELAYQDKRLTTPKGQAAADYYRQVIELEPDNEAAHQGLQEICNRYVLWGLAEVDRGRLDRARVFRDRAETVLPGSTDRLADAIRHAQTKRGHRSTNTSSSRQPTLFKAWDDMIHLRKPRVSSGGAEILEQD